MQANGTKRDRIMLRIGESISFFSGATVVGLSGLLLWAMWNNPGQAGLGLLRAAWIGLLGIIAIIAGAKRSSRALIVVFLLSFVPWGMGPYLFGTPGVFFWIPVGQFGYLVAAALMTGGVQGRNLQAK